MQNSKTKPVNWLNTIFLTISPIATVALLIVHQQLFGVTWVEIAIFMLMVAVTGLSVTGGYHRLFSHRTYEAAWPIRLFYLIFGAAALQNSALMWCSDHRDHHQFTDHDEDPYSIQKGFWWAHIGWIFYSEDRPKTFENSPDLVADPLLQWQHRHYLIIGVVAGFLFPALLGFALGGWAGALGGFAWGGFLRLVLLHHSTFLVNSAAHYFGRKTYSEKVSARDNYLLAFFTNGEGYHNYHHVFPNDYRNGITWYSWDPTKWIVYCLSKIGMTWQLKRVPDATILRTRIKREMENASEKLAIAPRSYADAMREQMREIKVSVNRAILRLSDIEQEIQKLKASRRSGEILRQLYLERKRELIAYRKNLIKELRQVRLQLGQISSRSMLYA